MQSKAQIDQVLRHEELRHPVAEGAQEHEDGEPERQ